MARCVYARGCAGVPAVATWEKNTGWWAQPISERKEGAAPKWFGCTVAQPGKVVRWMLFWPVEQ